MSITSETLFSWRLGVKKNERDRVDPEETSKKKGENVIEGKKKLRMGGGESLWGKNELRKITSWTFKSANSTKVRLIRPRGGKIAQETYALDYVFRNRHLSTSSTSRHRKTAKSRYEAVKGSWVVECEKGTCAQNISRIKRSSGIRRISPRTSPSKEGEIEKQRGLHDVNGTRWGEEETEFAKFLNGPYNHKDLGKLGTLLPRGRGASEGPKNLCRNPNTASSRLEGHRP